MIPLMSQTEKSPDKTRQMNSAETQSTKNMQLWTAYKININYKTGVPDINIIQLYQLFKKKCFSNSTENFCWI